ncbi:MAG: DUF6580 family putative transport protein [Candidatus Staskawiczbacteria bacterium]|jgi:hypothetical protein
MNKKILGLALLMIILAAASRLVKHPANFTPVAAMGIFSGYYLRKKWAIVVPLAAMFLSDIFIGFYDWRLLAVVYASMACSFIFGWLLQKNKRWRYVILCSVASSVLFFLTTNTAVWAFYSWYPHTLSGLIACLAAGLPFLKNTLLGDIFYCLVMFGALEAALRYSAEKDKPLELEPMKI